MTGAARAEGGGRRDTVIGIAWGLLVVLIWAAWVVSTRAGVRTSLGPLDIAFIRYACASLLLLPVAIRRRLPLLVRDARTTMAIVAGAGAPFLLVSVSGMRFAPASEIASVMIGAMPFFVALMAVAVLGERLRWLQWTGFAVVVVGLAVINASGLLEGRHGAWRGHLLFLLAAAMWGVYTVSLRAAKVTALHSAFAVNAWSLLLVTIACVASGRLVVASASWTDIAVQAGAQSVSAVIGLYAFGESVRRLGAARAAVVGALTPGVATLMAVPLLGEHPSGTTLIGLVAISAGVALASFTAGRRGDERGPIGSRVASGNRIRERVVTLQDR